MILEISQDWFFIEIQSKNPKNKLQTALLEWVQAFKHHLTDNVRELDAEIMKKVRALNAEYPKCQPVFVSFYESEFDFEPAVLAMSAGDWSISITFTAIQKGGIS